MKAHVICCNDGIEFVVIGTEERANKKLMEIKKTSRFKGEQYFWHLHEVDWEMELEKEGRDDLF